ncbi:sigma-70 family RNA polymerase sigma factor [Parasphingorhabdus litoris]|uniref:Sigma-70 family RNA polymerase sigma factor n=1 Tax=Parasphingorhabdus litoris TaxID=394733 RepID=A0ABN1AHH0_9SPHN|nr:sigma-70 family RNA polymerase sigma factor [Parasphingorhabdus litoris]
MRYSDTDRVYDELLLTRIQVGDRRAGERLAARWYPRLMRTAYRLLRDEEQARAAVQEAWSGICRGWMGLRDPSRFPAWAYRILHRKCADRIRKNQKFRAAQSDDQAAAELSSPPGAEDKVSIDQAFARLSNDHRFVATLYFAEGLTLSEIAAATDTPVGTAKSRLFHARRQLKAALN